MPDVTALGELLIDFVPTVSGVALIEAPAFQKAPGGAPANVAAGVAKLGVSAGFMGKVGDDAFGHFLAQTLQEVGVDTSALRFSSEARTALAFVSLRADGEREFMFYRHPSADMLYAPGEVDVEYIRSTRVFHYGSISLISEPSRSATLLAVEAARASEALISYDPNLRLALWPSTRAAKEGIMLGRPVHPGSCGARVVASSAAPHGHYPRQGRMQLRHTVVLWRCVGLFRGFHRFHRRRRWLCRWPAQGAA
jgi:fructokinase